SEEISRRLDFDSRRHRYDDIDEAHHLTFEWIFDDPTVVFTSWLQSGEEIPWITGLPGSGKSTLMKLIYDHPKTRHYLSLRSRRVALADFFFHYRGSKIDRSFAGLLRALLLQILDAFPELSPIVGAMQVQGYSGVGARGVSKIETWPPSKLKRALYAVAKQTRGLAGHICFFVDGLDEFEGDGSESASFFSDFLRPVPDQMLKMKACLSSRPHNAFQDEFRGCPSLSIHEKTKNDIFRYVAFRFGAAKGDWPLSSSNDFTLERLINQVVTRASGVFLWVRLVVNQLLQSLTDRDTISELEERLNELPEDLEDLYKRMLRQTRPRHLRVTMLLLQIVQSTCQPLVVLDICDAAQPFETTMSSPWFDYWSGNFSKTAEICQSMSGRIKSRCGGLLEIQGSETGGLEVSTVQFLHQTVKDFLARKDV
ncbi:hypothetical protein BGZ57DRAFT_970931, partial [Hyaloscypha finlandica]